MLTQISTIQKKPTRRCQGHCCRLFQIVDYSSHDKLWQAYLKWKQTSQKDTEGIHILAPMLIPKGSTYDGFPLFSCKHLSKGRDCTIYDHRPQMCRDLGTINQCTNQQCRLNPKNDFWWHRFSIALTAKRRPLHLLSFCKRFLPNLKRF